ncbi:hypothetical protein HID58_091790 [Brassica napus]|uniref:Uncharacterized protein n=1 Tax=Brassica napus TaxID=3708 RepID=A0ABQ7WYJ4_BRANA|nr:hypothetical protein HID58_091790 [Brassica napus]
MLCFRNQECSVSEIKNALFFLVTWRTSFLVSSKLALSFSPNGHSSSETRSLSYKAAIPGSPLANTISIRSVVTLKKG